MNNTALYIHIPFCVKKCAYCAFFSLCGAPDALAGDYFDALARQISLLPRMTFGTVYVGGGTPTAAGADRLCRLLGAVAARHDIAPDAEITVEANPGTVNADGLAALRSSGFNRLSLGLQSSDDGVLRALGRIHNADDFRRCFADARSAGFGNISADLIFALPRDFGDGLDATLSLLRELRPEHISAYSLSVEEGTPLYKKKESLRFPSEDEEEDEYARVCAAFSDYEHYEISSFARSGFRSRHNSAYWNMTPYIGIGAAAHSFYAGKRFSYPPDVPRFINESNVLFGSSDFACCVPENDAELEEERIMLGLRTSEGAMLSEKQMNKARRAISAGLAAVSGGRLILNERGYRVSNEIIAEILAE